MHKSFLKYLYHDLIFTNIVDSHAFSSPSLFLLAQCNLVFDVSV